MTFEQHLQTEIKRLEDERNVRRQAGQARQLLLPFRDSEQIRYLVRAICGDGRARDVE